VVRHSLRRWLDALVLLWLVATLTFLLIRLAPGDPASLLVAPDASAATIARQRTAFGLDGSLPAQYGRWLGALLRGDLGTSLARAQPVRTVIGDALPYSLWLGGVSLGGSVLLGVLAGGWQARRAGSPADTALTIVGTMLYAAPQFWLALGLVALATTGAASLGVPAALRLPAFGVATPAGDLAGPAAVVDLLRHSALPLAVLTLTGAAGIARYARGTMADAWRAPHVLSATARGLGAGRVRRRHVLRTAVSPLIVLVGLALPGIIAGSVFVEQVFAWPGLGRTMLAAIASRDYPVVLGLTLLYASVVIVANLTAELLVESLDPRRRVATAPRGPDA
jgi:peptide/nickel transport system permease protein